MGNRVIGFFRRGRWLRLASYYISHPAQIWKLLRAVRGYMSRDGLREARSALMLLWNYVADTTTGRYRDYSKWSLVLVVAALIYLVSPIDLIPDLLLGGLLDDIGVLTYVVTAVQSELKRYRKQFPRQDDAENRN